MAVFTGGVHNGATIFSIALGVREGHMQHSPYLNFLVNYAHVFVINPKIVSVI